MVRLAGERLNDLFALAEREAGAGHPELADRYVRLARKIGMRYNVRLLTEYRELYCRGCSTFWVEGRTVRTRLRHGRRVRVCLRCGRTRRTVLRARTLRSADPGWTGPTAARRREVTLVEAVEEDEASDVPPPEREAD